MKCNRSFAAMAVFCACLMMGKAGAAETAPAATSTPPSEAGPMVPSAKAGVYSQTKQNATRYQVSVKGHEFTTRGAIEKYLLFRAATLAQQQKFPWFTLAESRNKADTEPMPQPDAMGLHYSFRLKYWRPVWRYKLAGAPAWSNWSPFAGAVFFADGVEAKTITDFEVSAEIVMHNGPMEDNNPLAFEAGAVSDFLINQVLPPE
jgi:hypothetical protein